MDILFGQSIFFCTSSIYMLKEGYMYMLSLVNMKVDMQYTCMRNIRPTCTFNLLDTLIPSYFDLNMQIYYCTCT